MSPVLLALLGVVLTLDGVTVGQFMISRPLVAGGLAGLVAGDVTTGLLVGAILELFLLVAVPSGGGRFPEPGPASVVGAAGAIWIGGAGGLAAGIAVALVIGYLGALTQAAQRHLNERFVPAPASNVVTAAAVTRGHLSAVGLDALRGLVLTTVGLIVVARMGPVIGPWWPLDEAETRGLFLLGALVSLGIVARSWLVGRRWMLLATGTVLGVLVGSVFS